MKPFLLFLALLLGGITPMTGQAPRLGVNGGLNVAKWRLGEKSNAFENKSRTGLLAGVFTEFALAEHISLRPELNVAQFGANFKDSHRFAHYKTSYVLIPVLGRYNFRQGISAYLGPQIGFLMSAKSDVDGDKDNIKDQMKKSDLFLVLGGEYTFKNGLGVGLRIQHGLTNVEDGASTTIHNSAFTLMASYTFHKNLKEIMEGIF